MAKPKFDTEALREKCLTYLQDFKVDNDQLQVDREKWLNYYFQDKNQYDNLDGRSQVVTSDVFEMVESTIPPLMDIFYGGQDVVECQPEGPEDEEAAELAQKLLNYQFQREINGYVTIHDWIKDALLQKISFVKYWWEEKEEFEDVEYEDLTGPELMFLQQQPDLEITESIAETVQEERFDEYGMIISPAVISYYVKGKKKTEISHPVVEFVPGDEIIFDVKAKSVKDMTFISHRKRVHVTALAKYGIKRDDAKAMYDDVAADTLLDTRFQDLSPISTWRDANNDEYTYIYECFFKDYDDKCNEKHVKCTVFSSKVVDVEENTYKRPPFCALSPVIMPGRLVGLGTAETGVEFQDINTALTRNILDNIYFQNNGMQLFDPTKIEVDDLLTGNRPGGKVRVKPGERISEAIWPIPINPLPPQVFEMLQLNEARKENKSGINKYSMGSDSREVNRTATGVAMLTSNAQLRTKQIARNMAETGIKDLFNCLLDMNRKFLEREVAIKLDKKWQYIDPKSINGKYDIIVNVGLGSGQKEIKTQQMLQMLNISAPLVQMGVCTPENIQEIVRDIYELMGHKNTDKYVNTQLSQQMGVMNGLPGLPGQLQGEIGVQGPAGAMEAGGGEQTSEPRIDPRVLRALSSVAPQPLV